MSATACSCRFCGLRVKGKQTSSELQLSRHRRLLLLLFACFLFVSLQSDDTTTHRVTQQSMPLMISLPQHKPQFLDECGSIELKVKATFAER